MTVQNRLGDLIFLNIWHDNSGRGADASWNLIKVVVEDAATGKRLGVFLYKWIYPLRYFRLIRSKVGT